MERETGLEPATSSLGSWHSTTELLPHSCVFRYSTVQQGFSRFPGQSILSMQSIQTMGPDRKMDGKPRSAVLRSYAPGMETGHLPLLDTINLSQRKNERPDRQTKLAPKRCHRRMHILNLLVVRSDLVDPCAFRRPGSERRPNDLILRHAA